MKGLTREGNAQAAQAIICEQISKTLGGHLVLTSVSLQIQSGETVALIGPSGSGKSTLLRCLNLLLLIDTGEIRFFGRPIVTGCLNCQSKGGKRPLVHVLPEEHRREVGMVFQEFNLWDDRDVIANIVEGPIYALGVERKRAIAAAKELLAEFGLDDVMNRRPGELSGGQRQRVAIARALAMEPKVLLLDEITSALDPELVGDVLAMIRQLASRGLTLLVVTHYLEFARQVANSVVVLDGGQIIETGPAERVLTDPSERRTREFIGKLERAR